jgi:hypothetical protein
MATSTAEAKPAKRQSRRFLVNDKGRRVGVVLSMREYEDLVEAAEQRDDIRFLREADAIQGEDISLEELEVQLRAEGKLR